MACSTPLPLWIALSASPQGNRAIACRTIGEARAWATHQLQQAGVPDAALEAQLLLGHVLSRGRAFVLAHGRDLLPAVPDTLFRALVVRRALREPHAYLVGERAWLDVSLRVNRNVLIPRPETEVLAGLTIQAIPDHLREAANPVVVDVGTGSGALAIAVARACSAVRVYATDTSGPALATAARNVERNAADRVCLLQCDLLGGMPERANVVVANLPYIPTADLATLAPELAYEPRGALDGGGDGLDPIRALLRQAHDLAAPRATLLLECGHDQALRVVALARDHLPESRITVHPDLAGVPRFIAIQARDRVSLAPNVAHTLPGAI